MKPLLLLVLVFLIPITAAAQRQKTPVSVDRWGKDQVGELFQAAFKRQLSHSTSYRPLTGADKGFRLFVNFITVAIPSARPDHGEDSAISVVIEQMGLPNSFPVSTTWYHKLIVVNRSSVDAPAKDLLEDMAARWCSHIKNFIGGCPKETFEPKIMSG
jgi:hypothetical protein